MELIRHELVKYPRVAYKVDDGYLIVGHRVFYESSKERQAAAADADIAVAVSKLNAYETERHLVPL